MKRVVIFLSALLIIILLSLLILFDIKIELNESSTIEMPLNYNYNDQGASIKLFNIKLNKYFKINKKGRFDNTKVGTYYVEYKTRVLFRKLSVTKTIYVVDIEHPVIETDKDTIDVDYCKPNYDIEYSANDNYDGDITSKVVKTITSNYLILSVIDSSNNETKKEISLNYKKKPKSSFKLNGDTSITLFQDDEYVEPGYVYNDGCNNVDDINVNITGSVNTSEIGVYDLIYTLDYKGQTYTLNRTIYVIKRPVYDPNTVTSDKVVYLTFDDGPADSTSKLLDILDKYNVKATFFVTNSFPEYQSLIGEEAKRGHAIGVHSYTHKYNIYTSVDTYMEDFNKMENLIEQQTGSKVKIFRFPGGSSNTVSKLYSKGIMTTLTSYMQANGYAYFDWNVDTGDGLTNTTTASVYTNAIKGIDSKQVSIILMHDRKSTTVDAVEDIIIYGLSKGVKFETLNVESPTFHHKIAN